MSTIDYNFGAYRLQFWCLSTTILVPIDYNFGVKRGSIDYNFGAYRLQAQK